MLKAIFAVKRMLSKKEIILDALWHQHICTSLLLSANVRRQSLHLAVHCKPDCPSHCPVPRSPRRNPKDMHRTTTCLLSNTPRPSLSIVLCPLGPPGSLIVSQATYVSLISIWLWGDCIPEPTAGHGREGCREECNWFRAVSPWSTLVKEDPKIIWMSFNVPELDFLLLVVL